MKKLEQTLDPIRPDKIDTSIDHQLTCRPTVMLNRAISFFPTLREMGFLNLKGECEPFPDALPNEI